RNSVFFFFFSENEVSKVYEPVLNAYASVVTANKVACSSSYDTYKKLKDLAQSRNVKFIFETNVGAGLPVISTLNDLLKSGDKILGLEAVLSGTLNYIFNELGEDKPLSKVIMTAKELGYSEPDPRLDLNGLDVKRKILILSRECGYQLELEDIELVPLLPGDCFEGTVDEFWEKVKHYDEEYENNRKKVVAEGKQWRYVATMENGKAKVELKALDKSHPAHKLEGSNNIVLIKSERYLEQPMLIQGYGAGAEVTAAGVFADVIRVANI
ncbi:MAG: bifunctional aspartate kinase/homoserine dehydrogenase I, partial [Bacteroidales bacterium]|nr:bifunctional aspartate kinase/homoserine dehydrogenase I [Bacteroidales bacterium]